MGVVVYAWLLYGHLVGVGLLVVGMAIHVASIEAMARAGYGPGGRHLLALAETGLRLLIAGGVVLLGFGITLALRLDVLTAGWVLAALALIAGQGILGAAISEPGLQALHAGSGAAVDAATAVATTRMRAAGRASVASLLEIELLMTVKPTGAALWWSLLATVVVATALAASAWKSSTPRTTMGHHPG